MGPYQIFAEYFTGEDWLKPYLYLLSKRMDEGNVCLDLNNLKHQSDQEDVFLKAVEIGNLKQSDLIDDKDVIKDDCGLHPFIKLNNKLYTQRYFSYETKFINSIKQLIENENVAERQKILLQNEKFWINLESFFPIADVAKNGWQRTACILAFVHNFFVITGGPGTGKTTTVSKLLEILLMENPELNIEVAAPTGKAAARMKESFLADYEGGLQKNPLIKSLEPKTIHKLLGILPNSIVPKINATNKLNADVLIVDECSMIDITLFAKLVDGVDTSKTKLILLGDRNQLASVDAGSLFGDLCTSLPVLNTFNSETIRFLNVVNNNAAFTYIEEESTHPLFEHIVELQFTYRNSGMLGEFGKLVINGNANAALHLIKKGDGNIHLVDAGNEEAYKKQLNLFTKKIMNGYAKEKNTDAALKLISQSKILCAVRNDKMGVNKINETISKVVNKKNENVFYENKLLMVTRNQPELKLANGDIGILREDAQEAKKVFFDIMVSKDDGEKKKLAVIPGNILEWEEAYAMTIHKSQGSEFDEVLVVIPNREKNIGFMTRELLYTAVTRAKKKAVVVATEDELKEIIKNKVSRVSGIKERW